MADETSPLEGTAEAARRAVSDAAENAGRKGREAAQDAGEALTTLDATLRAAIRERPYTALAAAALLGFLYAVIRRP